MGAFGGDLIPRIKSFPPHLETDPVGYADQMNLYAYVGNNPLNATDPSGMCKNDPKCECAFDEATIETTRPQTGASLQWSFHVHGGSLFVADPAAFNMDEGIDIGTQIQPSINNGGYYASFAQQALAEPGVAVSIPMRNTPHGFNGELIAMVTRESARSIGRFTGEITDVSIIAATDGSYQIVGKCCYAPVITVGT